MKLIFTERNIVVILFVMVLITFSLAQEDSKKAEKMQNGVQAAATVSNLLVQQPPLKMQHDAAVHSAVATE